MGNHASAAACRFSIAPIMKINKASRVIFPSGEIRRFRVSVKAAEIMLDCPGFFLVNSRTLNKINRHFSPLSADEDLLPGNVYAMFPMRRMNSIVTPADMAVLWMAGKRISKRMPADEGELKVVEQPRTVVEAPEFSHRTVVCRSRKPPLDTITEEPVSARYKMLNWIR
ncbi:hypothetical protein E3N88_19766 [Mikania micrantha]|uniref:Uncharacterized protein n=1 Tax=Mikania micrantha TaxID=192012 RepID=A0A5N6NQT2_9ASTR|nr:hypothetical protein E3N88_19766 [Mikania micrantha]